MGDDNDDEVRLNIEVEEETRRALHELASQQDYDTLKAFMHDMINDTLENKDHVDILEAKLTDVQNQIAEQKDIVEEETRELRDLYRQEADLKEQIEKKKKEENDYRDDLEELAQFLTEEVPNSRVFRGHVKVQNLAETHNKNPDTILYDLHEQGINPSRIDGIDAETGGETA